MSRSISTSTISLFFLIVVGVSCHSSGEPTPPTTPVQTFDVHFVMDTHFYSTGNYDVQPHPVTENWIGVLVLAGVNEGSVTASLHLNDCGVCSVQDVATQPTLGYFGQRTGDAVNLDMTNTYGLDPWARLDGQISGSTFSGTGRWSERNGPNGDYYTGSFAATLRP
jgi:hypothetical protein